MELSLSMSLGASSGTRKTPNIWDDADTWNDEEIWNDFAQEEEE